MKNIELSNGVDLETLPRGQQMALRNAHQLVKRLMKKDAINCVTLMKLELLYQRVADARKQLKALAEHPKAIAGCYQRLFSQMHRLINGAEDKAFNTFSWENSYRTERDLERLERRLFVFEQVIFWITKELEG